MQESTFDRLNERMKGLLELSSPAIEETYSKWKSMNSYLPLGTNWLDHYSKVIPVLQNEVVTLCTEEKVGVKWIPNWINAIRVKALNEVNYDEIKAIIKNWKAYYF
ncbi:MULTISPECIES: hypothetical protein [unclassified Nostoc]|uniref:hypothetical protein n=1 Tax=unclassified Nostoc TaxID=2593658 RepID=UPI002AD52FD8|nr:hypothetical protein [Nostoc sp. DedQUE03]MDZ7975508.1 hypothetical protein [Nostoc sp. DedQUE03]MDZ8045559.1 hypothetical protein [Nostoc sp. DedQUE02]